jgi:riboflavin biosynthesis pyrimidine reductase
LDAPVHLLFPATDPGRPVDLPALYAQQPGVRLNMVASVDGAASLGGRSAGLSGAADREVFHLLRAQADVILVGAGTARDEQYGAAVVSPERQAERIARGQRAMPLIAVVSNGRGLPDDHRLTATPHEALLLTTRRGAHDSVLPAVVVGDEQVDVRRALTALAERGLTRVLCEGGPSLNGALLAAGLVTELCLTTSPLLSATPAPRIVAGGPEAVPCALVHLLHADGMLLGRWSVRTGG